MHCPRCGQPQVSEEIKFCSRCGFPLGLISEILAHGGFLPQLANLHKDKKWLTRRNGVMFSILWCMFFLLIMTPFWGILDVDALSGISAVVGIFGGSMIMVISLMTLKNEIPQNFYNAGELAAQNVNNLHAARQTALPPQTSQPIEQYQPPVGGWRAPHTGDLVERGSVTEGTTKLLQKDE